LHLDDWVCFWKIHVFHTIILWTFSENCWACCRCSDSVHLHVWIIMDSARSWISKFSMIFRWSYFLSNRNLSYFVLSIVFILDAVTSVRWLPQTCIAFICIVKKSTKFCKNKISSEFLRYVILLYPQTNALLTLWSLKYTMDFGEKRNRFIFHIM
jgi:hypothetical protein